jgi:uncharacterized protein (UPF0297 family)
MDDKTSLYDLSAIKEGLVLITLQEVYSALKERGYDPINQIVGFLITNDPGYISSYKDARKKMLSIDRASIIAILLKDFLR